MGEGVKFEQEDDRPLEAYQQGENLDYLGDDPNARYFKEPLKVEAKPGGTEVPELEKREVVLLSNEGPETLIEQQEGMHGHGAEKHDPHDYHHDHDHHRHHRVVPASYKPTEADLTSEKERMGHVLKGIKGVGVAGVFWAMDSVFHVLFPGPVDDVFLHTLGFLFTLDAVNELNKGWRGYSIPDEILDGKRDKYNGEGYPVSSVTYAVENIFGYYNEGIRKWLYSWVVLPAGLTGRTIGGAVGEIIHTIPRIWGYDVHEHSHDFDLKELRQLSKWQVTKKLFKVMLSEFKRIGKNAYERWKEKGFQINDILAFGGKTTASLLASPFVGGWGAIKGEFGDGFKLNAPTRSI